MRAPFVLRSEGKIFNGEDVQRQRKVSKGGRRKLSRSKKR